MAGFVRRLFGGPPSQRVPLRTTSRTDWEVLTRELFSGVIKGTRFGIAVVARDGGKGLHFRLNQKYPNPAIPEYVRKNLGPEAFAAIFQPVAGLKLDRRHALLVVAGEGMGLPRKTLLCPITHTHDPAKQALVIFGGERLEKQLQARLEELQAVLAGEGTAPRRAAVAARKEQASREAHLEILRKLDTKRLFDHELDVLAELVNALDEGKEELPLDLKAKYGTVSKFLLGKRLGR